MLIIVFYRITGVQKNEQIVKFVPVQTLKAEEVEKLIVHISSWPNFPQFTQGQKENY